MPQAWFTALSSNYKYTGARDPQTSEAFSINGDTATPAPTDLGTLIAAQNAAVNFDGAIPAAPPLPIAPTINQQIAGGIYNQNYTQPISAKPALPADVLSYTVTDHV